MHMIKNIHKILIANRGEIALRIIKTAKKLGIRTVAVYSEIDQDSLHVKQADESYCIGKVELSDTYLNISKVIDIALEAKCDAVHPGYGFLAENPLFVEACVDAGIIFIGPSANVMRIMGNKIEARDFVKKIKVPITEGISGPKEILIKTAHTIGFPVLLKAAAGGGGKGMRIVTSDLDLEEAIESTARQAKAYFGDETVYIEKFIPDPRHIEVQILGDHHGNLIHLFERECSIQRRYQKIIEESPSPTLTPEVRLSICQAAQKIGKAIGYSNAGTIEFLVDQELNFYFLEMNTRIQVEHPVTEMVTGIDIVEEQIFIASGNELRLKQENIGQKGHSIECRIYAEDPSNHFQPSPGLMTLYKEPEMIGIRIDTGISEISEIKSSFDPMISKLIVWDNDREQATRKMEEALSGYFIHGIKTNISYLLSLLKHPAFKSNSISTSFCDQHTPDLISTIQKEKEEIPSHLPVIAYLIWTLSGNLKASQQPSAEKNVWERIGFWRNRMNLKLQFEKSELQVVIPSYSKNQYVLEFQDNKFIAISRLNSNYKVDFTIGGQHYAAWLSEDKSANAFISISGHTFDIKRTDILPETFSAGDFEHQGGDHRHINSPMPGKVIKINVGEGQPVKKGQLLMIIEAMKMENQILSPADARISKINVALGERVEVSIPLIILEDIA